MKTSLSLLLLLAVACLGLWGSAAASASSGKEESVPITFPKIDRRPSEEPWSRGPLESLPHYDPESENPFQVDLRRYDLSRLDLRESLDDLLYATFDDATVWPPDERMPAGYDRERIVELGKDPGLGVRTLHEKGITGRGIGVAIIDQVLLTKHEEYADRLRLYEEINVVPGTDPQMHGAAVASIAVGKTLGVAPEADLYFIASWTFEPYKEGRPRTFEYYAQAVRRILEVNEQLPEDRKIRVISISVGWNPSQKGADEMAAATQEAVEAGMLVVCSSLDDVHGPEFKLLGLGRAPLDDPNAFESCRPWHHAAPSFYRGAPYTDFLMTPSDSRTTASPNGEDEYVFYREGGLSWSIPYAAGVYALAAQVDPEITPERFWSLAMKTGRTVEIEHDGRKLSMGRVIDPVALISALQGEPGAEVQDAGSGVPDPGADARASAGAEQTGEDESAPVTFPKIDRRPVPEGDVRVLTSLPHYDPESGSAFPVDVRWRDVSGLDLRGSLSDLLYATFNDRTVWPPDERMPEDYDRERIMELGKSPGLGVRKLHAQGITGRGVGVAIIDQPLLVEHQEYADRLRLYEEINVRPRTEPQMHGPAVASIAVGKTVGVAPEADLYFIASWPGDFGVGPDGFTYNFVYMARAIRRIIEVNKQLPDDRKIRVISISVGWNPEQKGYDDIMAACAEANAANILVVCCGTKEVHGFDFYGMGRSPYADPDSFDSCRPSLWQVDEFYKGEYRGGDLLVPMDSRTTASPAGADEYVFYRKGGYSWATPYLAGLYALAVQVDPQVTPERFWSLAMETGRTIELEHEGAKLPLGPIIDPVALIGALRAKRPAQTPRAPAPPARPQSARITFPKIDRHPTSDVRVRVATELPGYDPRSDSGLAIDLRRTDLSRLDLRDSLNDLLHSAFDDTTVWPPADRMPEGFDLERVVELGKNPGLGVRTLHARGVTGRGVGVAVIDQVLLIEHEQYADRLRLYEEINVRPGTNVQVHGPAVASLAVGKTIGVAPEADLYFIATWAGDWGENGLTRNDVYLAQAFRRIVEINKQLPDDRKIRVISISTHWTPGEKGYDEVVAACREAKAAGIFVSICCGDRDLPEFDYYGLGRSPYTDPDAFELREPPLSRAEGFYSGRWGTGELLIPMDSRTIASAWGTDQYVFDRKGGTSWVAPYMAGVYALAAQVNPRITPDQFRALAMQTGRTIEVEHEGRTLRLGPIIDPVALVTAAHKAARTSRAGQPSSPTPRQPAGLRFPKIDRRPYPGVWGVQALESLPEIDPDAETPRPIELRHCDLSGLDLRNALDELLFSTFDTRTVWPPREQLPREFNLRRIAALGANPGLGIRRLHARGITGRRVGIAVIDQPLLTTHAEYADRLMLYEEINVEADSGPQMHGSAVLSIAGGKRVGVAPQADLYYVGTWTGRSGAQGWDYDFTSTAQAIRRILEVNEQLPRNRKIRVISISVGWSPTQKGYGEVMAANREAIDAGLLVVSSSIEDTHGFDFFLIGRAPLSDPDSFDSCGPALYALTTAEFNYGREKRLLIPVESRTIAASCGDEDYTFYRRGGASWAIPYIAGLYALAVQVDPEITPERFWRLAMRTGRTVRVEHEDKKLRLTPVVDPVALIEAVQGH